MTKQAYMLERKQYRRPQAMLWADNYGNLVPYPSTLNPIVNSNFEVNTSGWTATVGASVTRVTAEYVSGVASAEVTPAASIDSGIYNTARLLLEQDTQYTFSAYVRDNGTTPTNVPWKVKVTLHSALTGGTQYGTVYSSTEITPNTGGWTRYSVTFTVPAGNLYAHVYVTTGASAPLANKKAYVDALLLQEGSVVNSYVDGTSPSYFYAPIGNGVYDSVPGDNFLIISDHNRDPIDFKIERIEKRERMINGRMRSYHVADKLNISTSWKTLPSRSFSTDPQFSPITGVPGTTLSFDGQDTNGKQYTVDGGAGGADLLKWYEDHQGPFWVYLSYDKPQNFDTDRYNHLEQYSEVIQMYISDFSWTVEKRGGSSFDFWNVSVSLEEV
jgi:hypothetical protein